MKHKKLTMIVALVLVVALAAGLGIWATGEENIPTVTYYDGTDGTNAHFTFTHTGKGSDTNLFPNFSDCMPGDSLTQTIRVQADSKNGVQGAKIYLRAEIDGDASAKEGSAITYNDVLDHISMTVSKNGVVLASNKTAKLFSQLDASEGLKSNVFIAEVSPKTDPVDLDVTIEVDPAMGNAFQEAAAHIAFVFSVEDNEVPPPPLEREKHDAYFHAPEVEGDAFSDISDSWAREYINRAAALGLVNGLPDGTFRPNAEITRAEVMEIINNVLFRTPDKDHFLPDMVTWPDNSNPDAWYYEPVQEATNSHDYERVNNTSPETWTKITQQRDWDALEAELAQKYPNR